jgi:hypothetical protein
MSAEVAGAPGAAPDKFPVLACAACHFPIATRELLLVEKFPCWEAEVYSYPLEILEIDDVWCYSATVCHRILLLFLQIFPKRTNLTQPLPSHEVMGKSYSWGGLHADEGIACLLVDCLIFLWG